MEEICLALAANSSATTTTPTYHLYLAYPGAVGPPAGLLPGNRFLVSAVRKVTSRHGTPYFRASSWTGFTRCSREPEETATEKGDGSSCWWRPDDGSNIDLLGKYKYLLNDVKSVLLGIFQNPLFLIRTHPIDQNQNK